MKGESLLLLIVSASLVHAEIIKWANYVEPNMTISCSKIICDFMKGKDIFEFEQQKGDFLFRSGYVATLQEPFAGFFAKTPLPVKEEGEFCRINSNLRGIQQIVDQLSQWYTGTPESDYIDIANFLNEASNCISQKVKRIPCNPFEKYRSFDGTCNNLKDPLIGSIVTPFSRLLPATYDDNVLEMRKSVTGTDLTSAREIVDQLFSGPESPTTYRDNVPNLGFFMYSQLLTHDVASQITMHHGLSSDGPIRCCSGDYKRPLSKDFSHYTCSPITIPKNDTFFSARNLGCHNYVRSQPIFPTDGKLSAAEQANRVTGYIDLSPIYGLTQEQAYSLRTFSKGRLIATQQNVLPMKENCNSDDCYYAGDFRINQTPHLAAIHSLFYRLHNQIARTLESINPHWDDERLYQETRRINIALMQHILYEEFYPILTGEKVSSSNGNCDYNSTIIGTTLNDFTTGVLRYLHAYTPSNFETYGIDGQCSGEFPISQIVDKARVLETHYEDYVRGLVYQGINLDNPYNDEVRNRLFNNSDLISVDIQRGRDHGLAPYWKYRELCGLPPIEEFSDLFPLMSERAIDRLKTVYKSPHDIDLLIGGGLETRTRGLLGPTHKCITKIQFAHYKIGDRFFYTHRKGAYPFQAAQLKEIKKFSFAKLLCLTTNIKRVPLQGFIVPSQTNPLVSCSNLQLLDLLPWLE